MSLSPVFPDALSGDKKPHIQVHHPSNLPIRCVSWADPRMQVLVTALLSLLAFVVVVAIGGQSSRSFMTHIGSRIPATELGCFQSGEARTDEGNRLKVFKCPNPSG